MIGGSVFKNYTLGNVEEFFHDINYTNGYKQYQLTGFLLGNLDPPKVTVSLFYTNFLFLFQLYDYFYLVFHQVHCIYGYDVDTPERFFWAKGYFPDYQPSTIYGDGDGTVNRRSLEACAKWMGNNGDKNVSFPEF